MTTRLFAHKKFWPLLASHLLSAVNENFLRTVFLFFATYRLTEFQAVPIIWAVLLYVFGFCAGSIFTGEIADRISKTRLLQFFRLTEILIMVLALLGLAFDSVESYVGVIALSGFVGTGLRVTGFSLIPSLLDAAKWHLGNMWIKLASVLGTSLGSLLFVSVVKFDFAYYLILSVGIAVSFASFFVSLKIPYETAKDADSPFILNPVRIFKFVAADMKYQFNRWTYIVGIAWFWTLMSLVILFSTDFSRAYLHIRWSAVMFLSSAVFTAGYIVGSFLYTRLFKKGILGTHTSWTCALISVLMMDFVFAGHALGETAVSSDLSVFRLLTTDPTYWRIIFDVFALGILGPLYIIPFYTSVQQTTSPKMMGRMWSFSSMFNGLSIAAAFLLVQLLHLFGLSLLNIIVVFAVVNLFVAIYLVRLLPVALRRKACRGMLKLLFGARIDGLEHLEKLDGKRALIVTNHQSYLDVLLISAFIRRPIVFAISNRFMGKSFVRFMTNLVDVRPLDPTNPFAVKKMVEELRRDQLCMIFMEGLVRGGNTNMKAYEGPALMALKGDAPILPIRIDGAKFALFSRVLGRKADFRWFPRIALHILPPARIRVPDGLTTREERERGSSQLYDIVMEMNFDAQEKNITIFEAVARGMRMVGRFKPMIEDTERKPMKFLLIFMKAFILGRLIDRALPDERRVGMMVPTSNTFLLTLLGLHAFGRTPAMINFTSGPAQVISTCRTVGLKTIITARKIVALAKLEPLVAELEKAGIRLSYLEDLKPTLTTRDKLFGIFGAFFPTCAYRRTSGGQVKASDCAVILFTSGSEGMPKAVLLSHANVLANVMQVPSRLDIGPEDVMLNCLPTFHSFGFTAGAILPLVLGFKVFSYPTPLHYRIIPEICASVKATIFFATDTFMAGYAKCANVYDFNSLRIVVVGAEKLKDETRRIYSEKFGIRILEGYGTTECAPVLSLNTFLHDRRGSVGKILPGMQTKLKAVDGIKEGQELWVRGPNVMMGYMKPDKPGALQPPPDGWYDTGDIVRIDADGYIFIQGRCKRFAKIGGEMVSLLAIEQIIDKHWPGFVTGAVNIPDEKKGEKIVLITTCKDITRDGLSEIFRAAGFTELGVPSRIVITDAPPLLGTGKFDYQGAKALALKECG
ncbi:MAG: AMP-binding protein [Alphaproteobacteria bacterium]|nr:AMP-binding protein [Alphaproteobacteria bacterium]